MEHRKKYSEDVVSKIREDLSAVFSGNLNIAVVVTGSFGRNEASEASDMDWFVVVNKQLETSETEFVVTSIEKIVTNMSKKMLVTLVLSVE
ncbi:nucleotidyltransferase domain-containing protein [Vibrio fluvialis]|uniref:nucleotidyltransferase domain-containing protein n=1 Tax=Vibrio fluvialis TaxID=676 RepID=UPI003D09DB9B